MFHDTMFVYSRKTGTRKIFERTVWARMTKQERAAYTIVPPRNKRQTKYSSADVKRRPPFPDWW